MMSRLGRGTDDAKPVWTGRAAASPNNNGAAAYNTSASEADGFDVEASRRQLNNPAAVNRCSTVPPKFAECKPASMVTAWGDSKALALQSKTETSVSSMSPSSTAAAARTMFKWWGKGGSLTVMRLTPSKVHNESLEDKQTCSPSKLLKTTASCSEHFQTFH